jgi:hypothetical protein
VQPAQAIAAAQATIMVPWRVMHRILPNMRPTWNDLRRPDAIRQER